MKVTGYSVRTYGKGTNPSGGRYIEVDGKKIYERLTSNKNGIPTDGGKNPEFKKLEEWVREKLGVQSVWDWAKQQYKKFRQEEQEKKNKEVQSWIEKIRTKPENFEAWQNSYSLGVILKLFPAKKLGDTIIEPEKALKLEIREGEVSLHTEPMLRQFMKPLSTKEFLEAWDQMQSQA